MKRIDVFLSFRIAGTMLDEQANRQHMNEVRREFGLKNLIFD